MRTLRFLGLIAALACSAVRAAPAAEAARTDALAQFRKDLVGALASHADAEHLLGAALLARSLQAQPQALTFHDLLARAAATTDAGPAVAWAQLGDCTDDVCPQPQALAKLQRQAPGNAAVWVLALNAAAAAKDAAAARAALAEAAARERYDGYSGPLLRAAAAASQALPMPAETARALTGSTEATAPAQWLIVAGSVAALPRPAFFAAAELCLSPAAPDDALRADCLGLGRALEAGDGFIARRFGLQLRARLAADPAQRDDARRAIRDLTWQFEQYSRLGVRALREADVARALLTRALLGDGELDACHALLRQFGVPLQAPSDWRPPSERRPSPDTTTLP